MNTNRADTFTNQELSKRLGINLAKWKRWSREFLQPDPKAGLQSGYARMYTIGQAFEVYLGGFLVASLKYSIPEGRKILTDINEWLRATHIYPDAADKQLPHNQYRVSIWPMKMPGKGFRYVVRNIIQRRKAPSYEGSVEEEIFREEPILIEGQKELSFDHYDYRILEISEIRALFDLAMQGRI
jgi:hypothetical protein